LGLTTLNIYRGIITIKVDIVIKGVITVKLNVKVEGIITVKAVIALLIYPYLPSLISFNTKLKLK